MAKTKRKAGKRASAAGRGGLRARKSGVAKTHNAKLRKLKPPKPRPHKGKPSLPSQTASLRRQLKAARMQQEASAEILRAVANASGDAAGPLQLIAETTARLFNASSVSIQLAEGSEFTQEYRVGAIAKRVGSAYPRSNIKVGGRNLPGTVVAESRQIHIPDLDHLDPSMSDFPGLPHARAGGARTVCGTPLRREDKAIGALIVFRDRLLPFTDDELAMLQSFADQAVIAIENARLFNEVQVRTRELQDSLQQQTATGDVLKVISRSAFDLDSVLGTLVESATRLCEAERGMVYLRKSDQLHMSANFGFSAELEAFARTNPFPMDGGSTTARAAASGVPVQTVDILADETQDELALRYQQLGGHRCRLGVPLRRDGQTIGVFTLTRHEARAFTDNQIELVQTFADQAVIAIENARLFDEVQARTRDLSEALQQQTATADVLKVISRSAFDLQAVFDTLLTSAIELSGASSGTICVRDGEIFPYRATVGATAEFAQFLAEHPATPGRHSTAGRVILSGEVICISDVLEDREFAMPVSLDNDRTRAHLGVPLLRNDQVEGALVLVRSKPGLFDERQIELVKTFADQAVIAIENVRLFDEVQARTKELAASLDELRAAQDRLVQTEKLASLGQLTAGIAHEIKNPLNFVNNFSALSAELIDELDETLAPAPLDQKMRGDVGELTQMLKSNLEKVVQHGKRADSIVKNMLLHSREGSGEQRPADINALLDESLNLAYHGARAEKPGFNITLQRDFDASAGEIELFPQEITRAFLNLISNGFYAASKRKAENGDPDFEPVLSAATKNLGNQVEIRIRDNGTGIPTEVKEKIFNPFFTTKPAGEGTGLGLSMSHDIIVKQHGGRIEVDTQPGRFTEFTIILPRTGNLANNRKN